MKKIKLFEDFISEAKEKFPDQIEGNDGIIFKKVSQSGDRVKYNQYYRGYDIDAGGHGFGSVAELERFMKDYILSNNLYNKYKRMPVKQIVESLDEGTYNNDREIAIYDGEDGLTHIEKRGNGYYGYNDEFDFEAKDKAELEKKLKSWKYKLISGSIDEAVSQDAHYVHIVTGCGQDAAQNFIDDNKIDGRKLADYVKQYKDSKEKYDVRDIIAGTGVGANKSFVKRFIKELK